MAANTDAALDGFGLPGSVVRPRIDRRRRAAMIAATDRQTEGQMVGSGTRRANVRMTAALAAVIVGSLSSPAAFAAEPPATDGRAITVDGERIDVARLAQPSDTAPTAREQANADLVGSRRPSRSNLGPAEVGQRLAARSTQSVTEDYSAMTFEPINASSIGTDGNAALVGTTMLAGSRDRMYMASTSTLQSTRNWSNASFFRLPGGEYYFGSVAAASLYRSRFVAVLPSFEGPASCASGYLNVAVSVTSDPAGRWDRYRIPMPDAFTDAVSIGSSDDKVVLAANQWDLDPTMGDCIGGAFEGSRIRVMDWADLLDGGSLTVRDVSPGPATSYYAWQPASNVPRTTTTAAGSAVHLVGDRFVGEWGHLAYAYVTGSVRAGTAALGGLTDLTATRSVRPLIGPPATIAAFPSGNGLQDEQIVSAVAQAGRLWLSTNDTCLMEPDTAYRACARFVILDTTVAPPAIVSDGMFVDVEMDTFNPQVGVSRDGTAYFAMARSSALEHRPIDEYLAYRAAGQGIAGPDETIMRRGRSTFEDLAWSSGGSVLADPVDLRQAWVVYPTTDLWFGPAGSVASRVKGGLTGDPGGVVTIGRDNGWVTGFYAPLWFRPNLASPIRWVRYSASPEVEATSGGPRLVHGRDLPSQPGSDWIDFAAPDLGGPSDGPTVTMYAQWQTGDGTWSAPTSATAAIDATVPEVTPLSLSFAPGTVGTAASIRVAWSVVETQSGVYRTFISQTRTGNPPNEYLTLIYGPTVRSTTRSMLLGYRYDLMAQVQDAAGNSGQTPHVTFTPRASQNTSPGLSYTGTWSSQSSSSFLGGSTRYSTRAGARVTYTFTGRAVGFVSTKGPDRGKAEIWVDGVKAATIDLRASSRKYRQVVWQRSWATSGTHTVQVRVLGTSGRPRVDADAFLRF